MKWIPVEMIQEVLTKREVNAFKVYVVMNHSNSGYFKASKGSYEFIMKHCGIKSLKTVRKHLNTLVSLGYIGLDGNTYYIRSFRHLIRKNKYRVEFRTEYLADWKAYLFGSFIGYLALNQRNKLKAIRGKKEGAPNQRLPLSYSVSLQSLESILKYSKSNSHIYKHLPNIDSFIHITTNIKEETTMKRSYFKFGKSEIKGCFLIGHTVFRRLPDKICPLLSYKKLRGKKLKDIRKDI